MEILIRQIQLLQRTLEADWDDLFIRDDQRPSLETLGQRESWKNPYPISRLIEELGSIESRRKLVDDLFDLTKGSDGNGLPHWIKEALYSRLPYDEPVDATELNIRAALIFAISGNQMAMGFYEQSEFQDALVWFGYAKEWQGIHYQAMYQDTKQSESATARGKKAANARHGKPGGSRSKADEVRRIWSTGKYSNRDLCAEEECAALDMSFSAARKALRNTPEPTR